MSGLPLLLFYHAATVGTDTAAIAFLHLTGAQVCSELITRILCESSVMHCHF